MYKNDEKFPTVWKKTVRKPQGGDFSLLTLYMYLFDCY